MGVDRRETAVVGAQPTPVATVEKDDERGAGCRCRCVPAPFVGVSAVGDAFMRYRGSGSDPLGCVTVEPFLQRRYVECRLILECHRRCVHVPVHVLGHTRQRARSGHDVGVKVHLVDGTYELFRQHYGAVGRGGRSAPLLGTIGVLTSTLQLLAEGADHIGVATDHVIESFRNDMWAGYKTSEGMEPELLHQIPLVEEALTALGVTVWQMVEWEADDALAAAAHVAAADPRVEQVLLYSPDKDLGQCVDDGRVVQVDRRTGAIIDAAAVVEKFGVPPAAIPDWLGLVGDTADGFPGLPGWGAKSASVVLARFGRIEDIPDDIDDWGLDTWDAKPRGAVKLAATLAAQRNLALLFRDLATVRTDVPVGTVDEWRWAGPTPSFGDMVAEIGAPHLADRADAVFAERGDARRLR
jgi:5'-3' exonuclease